MKAGEEALAVFASDIHPSSAVVPVQLDITDDASIQAAHTTIVAHLKAKDLPGLDVLINNAAVITPSFKETYKVNVFGTVAITESIRPLINTGGAILNISSAAGSSTLLPKCNMPTAPGVMAYSSSKSALNNLTVQWALEEVKMGSGIRVVSICPGSNATRMTNYKGAMSPAEGCKIMVSTALEKDGRTAVFLSKNGDYEW
ncbi:hypothetical protein C8R43DRAFT_1174290 [Mycena crocata]|nr:hypothetical protein C8R43DRAFT_1174290 [Mycena crocata]